MEEYMMAEKNEMKILVVDDFATMRRIVRNLLRDLGFCNVFDAEDGVVALNMLRRERNFEFVITDWNMPNMSGIEMWREMKKDEKFNHIKFIMVSSENDKNHIVTALKEGVHNYILKPFEPRTVKKRIESL